MRVDLRTTTEKVQACMIKHQCSLGRAKATVRRDEFRDAVYRADTLEDLKRVLLGEFKAHEFGDDY